MGARFSSKVILILKEMYQAFICKTNFNINKKWLWKTLFGWKGPSYNYWGLPDLVIILYQHLPPFIEENLMSHLLLWRGLPMCRWRCEQDTAACNRVMVAKQEVSAVCVCPGKAGTHAMALAPLLGTPLCGTPWSLSADRPHFGQC